MRPKVLVCVHAHDKAYVLARAPHEGKLNQRAGQTLALDEMAPIGRIHELLGALRVWRIGGRGGLRSEEELDPLDRPFDAQREQGRLHERSEQPSLSRKFQFAAIERSQFANEYEGFAKHHRRWNGRTLVYQLHEHPDHSKSRADLARLGVAGVVWILGLNAHHADASACLLRDGQLVAAVQEERLVRVKHAAGLPVRALASCLEAGGIDLAAIDHVAVNRDSRANRAAKLRYLVAQRPSLSKIAERLRSRARVGALESQLRAAFPGQRLTARFHRVQHHLAHMASAAYCSPFDPSVSLSVDQFGDFESAAWGVCRGNRIEPEGAILFPDSLGTLYSAVTQWLGFRDYGDEYKVMGLAAHGKDDFAEAMNALVTITDSGQYALDLSYFRHHLQRVYSIGDDGRPVVENLYAGELRSLLGPPRAQGEAIESRHRDIACSLQRRYEQTLFALLRRLYEKYQLPALSLAGGCALNATANGKIRAQTPFEHLFVPPAAGDAGGALGAALVTWFQICPQATRTPLRHASWGPSFSAEEVAIEVQRRQNELQVAGCEVQAGVSESTRCDLAAERLANGQVVAWFQGRMEWGARALGHRSILADPTRLESRQRINESVKRREDFRPFAPAVLQEEVANWFHLEGTSPFMTEGASIRAEQLDRVPAIRHVDGTARVQTVDRVHQPLFHKLIRAFCERSGVPMVLNTSFNRHEPIVCTPSDAIDCFLRSGIDALVIEDHVITRKD